MNWATLNDLNSPRAVYQFRAICYDLLRIACSFFNLSICSPQNKWNFVAGALKKLRADVRVEIAMRLVLGVDCGPFRPPPSMSKRTIRMRVEWRRRDLCQICRHGVYSNWLITMKQHRSDWTGGGVCYLRSPCFYFYLKHRRQRSYSSWAEVLHRLICSENAEFKSGIILLIQRVNWRHRIYGHDTIAILWV